MRSLVRKFKRQERGVVLVETLLAVPLLTMLAFGILEFGNMMWQRQQLQVGVKDAARYWSRCRPSTGTGAVFMTCDIDTAREIAFTGLPNGTMPRVPGWDDAAELTITPTTPPGVPGATDIVTVRGEVEYQGTPWLNAIYSGSPFKLGYFHQTRYQGW